MKPTSKDEANQAAERLAKELESPLGAQKLGDEAFKMVQEEAQRHRLRCLIDEGDNSGQSISRK